jgi:hypothetical protein
MITVLVEAGTVPPGQGAFGVAEFQLPLPAVVIVAAETGALLSKVSIIIVPSSTMTVSHLKLFVDLVFIYQICP